MRNGWRKRVAVWVLGLLAWGWAAGAAEITPPIGCDIGQEAFLRAEAAQARKVIPPPRWSLATALVEESSPLQEASLAWVESTLEAMTLDEKIGQMIMPWYGSSSASQVENLKIGGFIFSSWNTSGALSIVQAVNQLQAIANVPLWFAADAECGAGARFGEATVLPMNMALGAADSEVLAASAGWVTARECWALGIQIGFCPVVDVNTEPENPIISTRSYGDRPTRVAQLAKAFADGAHRGGMLTCLKHYPGHGPTDADSHTTLPTVDLPESELRSFHLKPYELMIAEGYNDLIMTAHIWCQAFEPSTPWPATLSSKIMTDILRGEFGYEGITISDAFTMSGLGQVVPDEAVAVVTGVSNGLDIILTPSSTDGTAAALKAAVLAGDLSESRIDAAVRRILAAKSRAGLDTNRFRDEGIYPALLKHPDHLEIAAAIARASITMVSQEAGVLPLDSSQDVLCLRLSNTSIIFNVPARGYTHFTDPLADRLPSFELHSVDRSLDTADMDIISASAAAADRVVVAGYDWSTGMTSSQYTLLQRLVEGPTPVIFVSMGSPYSGMKVAGLENYLCAYSNSEASQKAAAEALLGDFEPRGVLPVLEVPRAYWELY